MFLHNTVKIITVLSMLYSKKENSSQMCRSFLKIRVHTHTHTHTHTLMFVGFPSGKEPSCQCGRCKRCGFDPWVRKITSPEGGHSNPFQYSCLENPIDRGPWWATGHMVTKSRTRLKELNTHTHTYIWLLWELCDKETACQCRRCGFNLWSWKIPWTRKSQSTLVFLPGESHRQRSLVCYSP